MSLRMRTLQVHGATVLTSEGTAGNRLPGPELGCLVDTQGRQRSAYKSHCVTKNGPETHGLPPLWCVRGDEGHPSGEPCATRAGGDTPRPASSELI